MPSVRSAIIVVATITGACTPAQQRVAGVGVAGLGLLTTYAAMQSLSSCNETSLHDADCTYAKPRTTAAVGVPLAIAGLGVALVGGAILTSGSLAASSPPSAPAPEVPSARPTALDTATASGMAVGYLVTAPPAGKEKPLKLVSVDASGSLRVVERHAELSGLVVRKAPDAKRLALTACFEFSSEWVVASVGTTPCGF